FGGVRTNIGSIFQTDYGYTGQRNLDEDIGLMDYKFRFYSPYLNRFIQPDSIIASIYNSQSYNRYSYVHNNPIIYTDPTGHEVCDADGYCNQSSSINQRNSGNGSCMGKCPSPKPPKPKKEEVPLCSSSMCNPNAGSSSNSPQIGPSVSNHDTESPNELTGIGYMLEFYQWAQQFDGAFTFLDNVGRPIYKHAKGVLPGGFFLEGFIGFSLTLLADMSNPNLSLPQRLGRAAVIGFEDGITASISNKLATLATPFGVAVGASISGALVTPETAGTATIPAAGL